MTVRQRAARRDRTAPSLSARAISRTTSKATGDIVEPHPRAGRLRHLLRARPLRGGRESEVRQRTSNRRSLRVLEAGDGIDVAVRFFLRGPPRGRRDRVADVAIDGSEEHNFSVVATLQPSVDSSGGKSVPEEPQALGDRCISSQVGVRIGLGHGVLTRMSSDVYSPRRGAMAIPNVSRNQCRTHCSFESRPLAGAASESPA
jgi:hypothetical protein